MNSILARMGRVYRILRKVHGRGVAPFFVAVLFASLRFVVWLGMSADRVLFPKLRRPASLRPIVLVGNPRTGTTGSAAECSSS